MWIRRMVERFMQAAEPQELRDVRDAIREEEETKRSIITRLDAWSQEQCTAAQQRRQEARRREYAADLIRFCAGGKLTDTELAARVDILAPAISDVMLDTYCCVVYSEAVLTRKQVESIAETHEHQSRAVYDALTLRGAL